MKTVEKRIIEIIALYNCNINSKIIEEILNKSRNLVYFELFENDKLNRLHKKCMNQDFNGVNIIKDLHNLINEYREILATL